MFAKVVVDVRTSNLNETYDYLIPNELEDFVGIGSRVSVEFGRQELMGYVIEITDTTDYVGSPKPIKQVLDFDQELTTEQIALAYYISSTYYVSMVSVLELMIPSYLKGQKRKYLEIKNYDELNPDLAMLFGGKNRLPMDVKYENYLNQIKQEIKKGNITLNYDLYTYGKGLKQKQYYINDSITPTFKSEKRRNIYEYIKDHPLVTEDDIIAYIDCTYNIIREMCKDETIKYHEVYKKNVSNETEEINNLSPYTFTFNDNLLIKKYDNSNNNLFLLHSNKEDFKVNFYIKVIEENKKKNLVTLITSPTIMLEEEITMYLKRYLRGYNIYGMSSKNSKKDRYEVFMNAKYNNLDVLVTTHNGIFMPINNIGTIIVLDEENNNYINENYPYYDAVDVLIKRAQLNNAKLILSTSSPSIDTYYKTLKGEFSLLSSFNYLDDNIRIVDMKDEILNGSSTIISNQLKREMDKALNNNNQVMLLVNSKAYSNIIRCRKCGKVLRCPKCNTPLTLYKDRGFAKCNLCDFKVTNYDVCSCGSHDMIGLSFGEERLKEEISALYPNKNILEVNADLMKTIDDYNIAINDIEEGNVDIIIGTNILSKTIKADNIKLVGIINIDAYLNSNTYKANENTFNFITKLNNKELVIVQTYYPNNKILKYAKNYEFVDYYNDELENRKLLEYDPFEEINKITITGEYNSMYHMANYIKKIFNGLKLGTIIGPSYDYKIKGIKMIIKHNDFDKVIKILKDTKEYFKKERVFMDYQRCPKYL